MNNEKNAFMRVVKCDIMEGAQSFNIDLDILSGPQSLEENL